MSDEATASGNQLHLTYGNLAYGGYSPNGGSRLILTQLPHGGPGDYINFDCTKPLTISFTANLDNLRAGTIFALYLVCMDQDAADAATVLHGYPVLGNTEGNYLEHKYWAEWGLGYRDVQAEGVGPSIELDLFEGSSSGAQFTVHGYNGGDPKDKSSYDSSGTWHSVNGEHGMDGVQSGTYNSIWGPSDQFKFNTLEPVQVTAVVTPAQIETGKYSVELEVTLSQGPAGNPTTKTFTVNSEDSNYYFPEDQLKTMNLVTSIWATSPAKPPTPEATSWWLDGTNPDNPDDIRGFASASPENKGAVPPEAEGLPESNLYWDQYATPAQTAINAQEKTNASNINPLLVRVDGLSIKGTTTYDTDNTICFVLDGMYRGIKSGGQLDNWHGTYDQTYGVGYNSESPPSIHIPTTALGYTQQIPGLLSDSEPAPTSADPYPNHPLAERFATFMKSPPDDVSESLGLGTKQAGESISNKATAPITTSYPWNYLDAANIPITSD